MKLKSKLIPLAGLAATVATVAPISLTSCGAQLNGGTFNLVDGYNAKFERLPQGAEKLVNMNNQYCEHLTEKPEAFIDDILWSKANLGTGFEEAIYMYGKTYGGGGKLGKTEFYNAFRFGMSDAIYKYENVSISGLKIHTTKFEVRVSPTKVIQMNVPIVSCKINFNAKIKSFNTERISGMRAIINGTVSGSVEYNNFPFWVYPRNVYFPLFNTNFTVNCCTPFVEWVDGSIGQQAAPFAEHFDIWVNINSDMAITTSSGQIEDVTKTYSFSDDTHAYNAEFTQSYIYVQPYMHEMVFGPISSPVYFQRVVCTDIF